MAENTKQAPHLRPLAEIYQDLGEAIAAVLSDDRIPAFLYNGLVELLTDVDNAAGSPSSRRARDVAHARYFFARLVELATEEEASD
jgi:nitrogenase molybdenum-iron protein alpha/beta subunit